MKRERERATIEPCREPWKMLIWQHLVASFIYRRALTLYGVVTAVPTNRIYTTHATDSERERKRQRERVCEIEVEKDWQTHNLWHFVASNIHTWLTVISCFMWQPNTHTHWLSPSISFLSHSLSLHLFQAHTQFMFSNFPYTFVAIWKLQLTRRFTINLKNIY